MTTVSVDHLTKVFGDPEGTGTVAVDDLTLDIENGELITLLGPSGCGKTTTLRMIAGLESPSEGRVEFDEEDVTDLPARERDVAMVFQDFALYPHMTVKQNLSFGLKRGNSDMDPAEIEERAQEISEMLEIEGHLDKPPRELSGGQKQRVALGRAIVREPRLFLFDEPLANLDAKLRKTMRTEIEELQNKMGTTSVYVTHNQEEAMSLGDRIAVFNKGELQQCAPPEEVFNKPANIFVADFIGSPSMNMVPVSVDKSDDNYHFSSDDISITIPADFVTDEVGAEVVLGFRPQDIRLGSKDSRRERFVEAEARVIEPLGTETVIHAESKDRRITAELNRSNHNINISPGDSLEFAVDARNIYLFDGETGQLIKPRQSTEEPVDPQMA